MRPSESEGFVHVHVQTLLDECFHNIPPKVGLVELESIGYRQVVIPGQ